LLNNSTLVYGNGKFVAGGSSPAITALILTSTNAIDWTTQTASGSLTFTNGYFFRSSSNTMYSSTDASTWTTISNLGASGSYNRVVYGNGIYISTTTLGNKCVYGSTLTSTWQVHSIDDTKTFGDSVIFANEQFSGLLSSPPETSSRSVPNSQFLIPKNLGGLTGTAQNHNGYFGVLSNTGMTISYGTNIQSSRASFFPHIKTTTT
jgi:hypothetical protein